jgi:hypothetical protein
MPTGNSYPAPHLPLVGTEQFTGYQQQGNVVATVTISISQLAVALSASQFSSPPSIGSVTPNTGAFTYLTVTNYESLSTAGSVVASGTSQSTATALTKQINVVTSVSASTGVILPNVAIGTWVRVFHEAIGGSTLSVYPPLGQQIQALGTNSPSGMVYNQANDYCYTSLNQWFVK